MKIWTSATGVCGMVLLAAVASAQDDPAPAPFEAPKASDSANVNDAKPGWTESLGQPSVYVERARADVGQRRYKSAVRNLRTAATILAATSKNAYGLDRKRLRGWIGSA